MRFSQEAVEDKVVEARRPLKLLLSDHKAKRYGLTKLVAVRRMGRKDGGREITSSQGRTREALAAWPP